MVAPLEWLGGVFLWAWILIMGCAERGEVVTWGGGTISRKFIGFLRVQLGSEASCGNGATLKGLGALLR
jgi:hypothetical protein